MRLLLLIVAVVVCQASYTSGRSRRQSPLEKPISEILPAVTDSVNRFAFRSYKTFPRDGSPNIVLATSDLFLSHWAMSLGSAKPTTDDFSAVFPPPGLSDADIERGLRAINDQVRMLVDLDYNISSNIYHNSGFQPTVNYRNIVRRVLLMEEYGLDFNNKNESHKKVNNWISLVTQDKVKVIVTPDDFTDDMSLALVNYVSFKGWWAKSFSSIPDQTFHVGKWTQISIPFMQQIAVYAHGELPHVKAKFIEIPYKGKVRNMGMSMFVILPDEVDGLPQLEDNIDTISLAQLLNGQKTEMVLKIPKFSMGSRISVNKPYWQTDSSAETINKIIHYVTFGVKGPDDSDSTNVSERPEIPQFVVDRPFLIVVATTRTNPVVVFTAGYIEP